MKKQTVYILLITSGMWDQIVHCEVYSEEPTFDLVEELEKHSTTGSAKLIQASVDGGDSITLAEA